MTREKIIIGITHGDFNGIGYEVLLKTLSDSRVYDHFTPVIYGSARAAAYYKKGIEQQMSFNVVSAAKDIHHKRINVINCVDEELKIEPGISSPLAGKMAFRALERATDDIKSGLIHAIVTAPINKANIQSENFKFAGHTEYLEQKFTEHNAALMMLVSNNLRVAVVTGHIPLKEVSAKITVDLIVQKLETLNNSLIRDFKIPKPRIAVLGLNPHAGDEGVTGTEEREIIIPAMKIAENKNILNFGTFAADGFFGSEAYKDYDAILAMYHDQGLVPFKTLAMGEGVNFTAGLPIVRTSPDHGTAYNIAGKNAANENSFRQALYMAFDIVCNRMWYNEISENPIKQEAKLERGGKIE
ncbi:MAG: 4-hydroxythreonine-4-phosphate dehydrogenase PdxA [Prevotellaceae bacterium]|jgi:4-hydroxythreonine-4-phosphate dehydrogenase|nr:4-hydroxythreonine-4-phosphate dehydrogenase PdxA [Prevotellaceae bacterium]